MDGEDHEVPMEGVDLEVLMLGGDREVRRVAFVVAAPRHVHLHDLVPVKIITASRMMIVNLAEALRGNHVLHWAVGAKNSVPKRT